MKSKELYSTILPKNPVIPSEAKNLRAKRIGGAAVDPHRAVQRALRAPASWAIPEGSSEGPLHSVLRTAYGAAPCREIPRPSASE